jgi:hypothetical protein
MKNARKAKKERAMQQNIEQQEVLSSDVMKFCSLLARIIYRCLKERDSHLLALLREPADDDPRGCGEDSPEQPV